MIHLSRALKKWVNIRIGLFWQHFWNLFRLNLVAVFFLPFSSFIIIFFSSSPFGQTMREIYKRKKITIYKSRKNNNNERCTEWRCEKSKEKKESVTNHDDLESWHIDGSGSSSTNRRLFNIFLMYSLRFSSVFIKHIKYLAVVSVPAAACDGQWWREQQLIWFLLYSTEVA